MFLRRIGILSAVVYVAGATCAQQPGGNQPIHLHQADKTVTYASAADVAALVAQAERKSVGANAMVVGNLLRLDPFIASLEYRPSDKSINFEIGLHPKEAELLYVIDGSGTLVTGGRLAADKMRIEGGQPQKVSKGDFILIPENTLHWFSHVDKTLVLMSMHVPRPPSTH